MSFKDMFLSIAGAESADLNSAIVEVAEVTAEEAAEAIIDKEIAEHERDLAVASTTLEKQGDALEALTDRVEDLQEEIDGMETMLSGTTPFNAGLFNHHYKTAVKISNQFGAKIELKGAESFANLDDTQVNGFEDMKAIKDVAAKAGEAVKSFFVELFNQFSNAIAKSLDVFNSLRAKADALEKMIGSRTSIDGEVTKPAYVKADGQSDVYEGIGNAFGVIIHNPASAENVKKIEEALKFSDAEAGKTKALTTAQAKAACIQVSAFAKLMTQRKDEVKKIGAADNKIIKDLIQKASNPEEKAKWTEAQASSKQAVKLMMKGISTAATAMKGQLKMADDSTKPAKSETKDDKKED